jgi:hypothetical protein
MDMLQLYRQIVLRANETQFFVYLNENLRQPIGAIRQIGEDRWEVTTIGVGHEEFASIGTALDGVLRIHQQSIALGGAAINAP